MDYKAALFLICTVVIFSYLFDLIARRTRFPSVVLLIGLGLSGRLLADYFGYKVPYLDQILPSLGKIGLILIVLEAALELRITREKRGLIWRSFLSAWILLIATALGLAYVFYHYLGMMSFRLALIYAIPLSVISSAVAIPSVSGLSAGKKEFIVYESTFSDILGVILFNFVRNNAAYDLRSFVKLGGDTLIIFVAAIVIAYFLLELLDRIAHHVQFFLLLSILVIFYLIGDKLHLPALIIIFFFGLAMSNLEALVPGALRKYTQHLRRTEAELHRFFLLSAESAFLVRTFFFLAFGYSIDIQKFSNWQNYSYAGIVLSILFALRFLYLYLTQRKNVLPQGFIAPRGLISVLLFLGIPAALKQVPGFVPDAHFLLLIILGSMFVMLYGTLRFGHGDAQLKNDENPGGEKGIDETTQPLPDSGIRDGANDWVN
ncbi:MAG: cation:proton antiporter [Flavobacteriales bacterium]